MKDEDKGHMLVYIFIMALSTVLWLILIGLKAVGAVDMHWALVLISLWGISWGLLALFALAVAFIRGIKKFKRIYYLRKAASRFIKKYNKECKDSLRGVSSEALEGYAEMYDLKPPRLPGETDEQLRERIRERIVLNDKDIKVSIRYEKGEIKK